MFQATQLIEFIKEQRKNQNTSLNDVNDYKCLNIIINYIEENTGWEYINDSFILRTNFKYDREKKDITFDIYKVERRNNLYTSHSNNPIELSFLKENQFILRILENLQQKQSLFYKDNNKRFKERVFYSIPMVLVLIPFITIYILCYNDQLLLDLLLFPKRHKFPNFINSFGYIFYRYEDLMVVLESLGG